jgi:hypothetical protein
MLLHITNDDQLINWWKKWIDFVKIKFQSNGNIESHYMHFESNELKWIHIWLNRIQIPKLNWNTMIVIWSNLNWISIQINSIQQLD